MMMKQVSDFCCVSGQYICFLFYRELKKGFYPYYYRREEGEEMYQSSVRE